jgi:hypothetical protein
MTDPNFIGEKFRDSVAFARSVVRDDWDAAEIIAHAQESPYDLMVPLSWLLTATIGRLSDVTGVSVDEVWQAVLESIDNPEIEDE